MPFGGGGAAAMRGGGEIVEHPASNAATTAAGVHLFIGPTQRKLMPLIGTGGRQPSMLW